MNDYEMMNQRIDQLRLTKLEGEAYLASEGYLDV